MTHLAHNLGIRSSDDEDFAMEFAAFLSELIMQDTVEAQVSSLLSTLSAMCQSTPTLLVILASMDFAQQLDGCKAKFPSLASRISQLQTQLHQSLAE